MSYRLTSDGSIVGSDNMPVLTSDGNIVTGRYNPVENTIHGSDGHSYEPSPQGTGQNSSKFSGMNPGTGNNNPHNEMQQQLGKTQPKSTIPLKMFGRSAYIQGTAAFDYGNIKHGVMPDIDGFISKLATNLGFDSNNPNVMAAMLRGLVADFYANGASDKRDFTGSIEVDNGNVVIDRAILKDTMTPLVGSQYRRVARAFAPVIVRLLQIDSQVFMPLISARAKEMSVAIEDAVWLFDGADVLSDVPSHLRKEIIASRMIRLSRADLSSNIGSNRTEMSYGESYDNSVRRAGGINPLE